MKKLNERFSEETLRQLMGLYIINSNSECFPLVPSEKPLTVDNFGLLEDDVIYTAEDFQWCEEDGSDRNLKYNDSDYYLYGDDLPDEVFYLLNTVICIKFATHQLADAKAMIDATDNDEAKQAINEAFIEFENLDDATESMKKLQIACDALNEASDIFESIDDELCNTFYDASDVINDVIRDLEYASGKS